MHDMHNGHREENMTFFKSLSSLALGAALLSSTAFAGEIVIIVIKQIVKVEKVVASEMESITCVMFALLMTL